MSTAEFSGRTAIVAIADAGLKKEQIDGLITGGTVHYEPIAYRTGLTDVRFCNDYPSAGRMCPMALMQAAQAVEHGLANYVVLFNSVCFRSNQNKFGYGGGGWIGMEAQPKRAIAFP